MKKSILGLAICLLTGLTLAACNSANDKASNVPTYQGMTLSHASKTQNKSILKKDEIQEEDDTHEEHDEKLEEDITEIVTIDVPTDDEVKYYVKPNETFIIEVHLSNPNDFEIQSFTLNGKKYSNYMFKDGSTMELLLLETTAPSESGYINYTIDAIKYIDGTEIKDVDMSKGNKSIKAGVSYTKAPSAKITSYEVGATNIELRIDISDSENVIGENEIAIYLSDGGKSIASKELAVGENSVIFNNLDMNKTYQYGILTTYDFIDGKDLHPEWILKNTFSTLGAFNIINLEKTKTEVSFEIETISENSVIDSISLYDVATNKLVEKGDSTTRSFTGLLTNHSYNLYVDYSYEINGETKIDWVKYENITTDSNGIPSVNISNETVTDSTIKATLSLIDNDSVGFINSVEIYKNNELVSANSSKEISFDNLESYSDYEVKVSYSYDLKDGLGVQTEVLTKSYKTSPHLSLVSCNIINTSAVSEGETIYIQASLDNPSNAMPSSVVINGKTYTCTSSTSSKRLFVEIVNNGQFDGGETVLTIERINLIIDNKQFSVLPTENNFDTVFVYGTIKILDVYLTDYNYTQKYSPYSHIDDPRLVMEVANPSGYTIDSIATNYNDWEPVTKIDNNRWELWNVMGGFVSYNIIRIDCSINSMKKSITTNELFEYCLPTNEEPIPIYTKEDLMSIDCPHGCGLVTAYSLQNDIDLSGEEWTGIYSFDGVLFGNNYAIKNMSRVGAFSDYTLEWGLFESLYGVVLDLKLENVTFIINVNSNEKCHDAIGCIAAQSWGKVMNCSVDENSIIQVSGNVGDDYYCGTAGFVGYLFAGSIENCINHATIKGAENAAGIVGANENGGKVYNCENYGTISGTKRVAGIVCINEDGRVFNCKNYGSVTSTTPLAAGIVNYNLSVIEKCDNYGKISNPRNGICASVNGSSWSIIDCHDYSN